MAAFQTEAVRVRLERVAAWEPCRERDTSGPEAAYLNELVVGGNSLVVFLDDGLAALHDRLEPVAPRVS